MPEEPTYSERGFAFWEPIEASYGTTIDVHESSAAAEPHVWVQIDGDCHLSSDPRPHPGISHGVATGNASAHLTMDGARRLRDNLGAAIKHSEARFTDA